MEFKDFIILSFMAFLIFIGFLLAYIIYVVNVPTAMDVYQGKTTLEYTYRDGIAIDSIVVFKNLKD